MLCLRVLLHQISYDIIPINLFSWGFVLYLPRIYRSIKVLVYRLMQTLAANGSDGWLGKYRTSAGKQKTWSIYLHRGNKYKRAADWKTATLIRAPCWGK